MSQPLLRSTVLISSLVVFAPAAASEMSQQPGLSFSGGIEYQLITQEYYNAIVDTSTLDPIEIWTLAKDEINDLFFRTNFNYSGQLTNKSFGFCGDLEVSDERLLGMVESHLIIGNHRDYVNLSGKYENKSIFEDSLSENDEYDYFQGYLKARKGVGKTFGIEFKTGFETVIFKQPPAIISGNGIISYFNIYNYDYSIISARLGGDLVSDDLSRNFYWFGHYQRRLVPDSSSAEYNDFRFLTEYTGIGLEGFLNIESELQLKDYNRSDDASDFIAAFVRNHFSGSLDSGIEAELGLTFENYWYPLNDFANQDYRLIRAELKVSQQIRYLNLGPLVRVEFKGEKSFEGVSESYGQWELGGAFSFLNLGSLFFDGEATYGQRSYRDQAASLTSFDFISVSLIADYSIFKGFSANLIFDGDFEKHGLTQNDTRLYLLTASVSARF